MSKKERFTEEHEKMATIPKLNSALFTIENYNRDNSILLYFDKMQKYAVGWCYADETTIGCGFLGEIAVMYEVSEDDERLDEGKYWCHLGKGSFINLFIPKMLEVKKPSLVEELKQQLAEKEKEIADLHTTINQDAVEIMMLKDYIEKRKSFIDERIVEKDKEIEGWKENSKMWENWKETYYKKLTEARQQLKDQRHQICEKIRHRALLLYDNCPDHKIERMYGVRKCLLDQIEKGE